MKKSKRKELHNLVEVLTDEMCAYAFDLLYYLFVK